MKPLLASTLAILCLAATPSHAQTRKTNAPAQILEITTADTALVLLAKPGAPVLFRHYGAKTNDPRAFLNKGYRDDLEAYPALGGANFANLALSLTHADGSLTTELVYAGHDTRALDDDRQETIVHLKDTLYPLTVDLHITAFKTENVITQRAILTHHEPAPIRVENIASASLPLQAGSYYLTHFHGAWGHEMQLTEEKLTPGDKVIENTRQGVQTAMSDNPSFMLALDHPADETSGEVYAGALAWSGNFKIIFSPDELETLHITAGMNPFASARILAPGESLQTPDMILTYSATGRGQASRNLHDWARRHSLAHGDQPRPVLLNSWEGAYFNFDEKTLTTMIDNAAALGIEMFVLDDGWFGNKYPRDNDRAGLGDWQVNNKKLPRAIAYLADYAVSKNLRFGIWIEPEMVNPKSELAEQHPDWIIKSPGRDIPQRRNQWVLDLANPAVQDFVFKVFDDTVSLSPNITYIKWDANRPILSPGSTHLSAGKQTHLWQDYVTGLYNVYDRVRAKYPNITIQLCSSGGARVDYGALKYHDEFWTSDNTNAVDRVLIQYGANMIYPPIATASHVSASPNHQTGMTLPLKFRFDVASSGRLGMELQPKDITGDDLAFAKTAIQNYKQTIRPLVQFGDLHRLVSPYANDGRAALMYVAKDKTQAVLFAYNLHHFLPRGFTFAIKPRGLDPAKTYEVTDLNLNPKTQKSVFPGNNKTCTGDYLMKAGINLAIRLPHDSAVLYLVEKAAKK